MAENQDQTAAALLISPEELAYSAELVERLMNGLNSVILGKEETIREVVAAFLARGHVLIEGLPGLGKTQLIRALAQLLKLEFKRIQFTPDLLPGDITGSHILEESEGKRSFRFRHGPVFGNIVLADEINRASPKTQSALLEAMQERSVTVLNETFHLPDPFFVLATQNPIELEGTYPLPEAQLDRFIFKVEMRGVDESVLRKIITARHHGQPPPIDPVMDKDELERLFGLVDRIHISRAVADYISRLVSATHPESERAPEEVKTYVKYGASPRAAIALAETSRAVALINGRPNVSFDDARAVTPAALAHRLVLDYSARLEGLDARDVVDRTLRSVPRVEEELPETLREG